MFSPVHQIDQSLYVFGIVFRVDDQSRTWSDVYLVRMVKGNRQLQLTHILPVVHRSDSFVLQDTRYATLGNRKQVRWWYVVITSFSKTLLWMTRQSYSWPG